MDEHPRPTKVSPEIYVYATNKNFLNVYDALRIDKVKIEVAGYDQASGKQTGIASAWLDLNDLRLLAHLVINRQFPAVLERGRFEKFGGSDRDGATESRTLLIEWAPDQQPGDGRFARYPYRITIANGPGQRTPNGAVQPRGEPTSKMSMRLPEVDMIKIMLATYDYLHAYETAHHHRLAAEKAREVQEKLAGRAERRLPVAAAPDEDAHPVARTPAAPPTTRPATPPLRVVHGPGAAAAPRPVPHQAAVAPAQWPVPRPTPPVVAQAPASRPARDAPASRLPRPTRAG